MMAALTSLPRNNRMDNVAQPFDAFARFYHADYGDFRADLPFYRALARRATGRIIELMCGSGRLLLPLAHEGFAVSGIDISPALIEQARQTLEQAGYAERVALYTGDVRAPIPGGPYDLAFVALNSFMHLINVEDQIATLIQAHAALAPGGLLALDLFNPDPHELLQQHSQIVLDKTFALADGTAVQKYVAQSVDMAAQVIAVTFLYDEIAGGSVRRTTLPFQMRWLYRFELEHLLARCGFALEAVFGSYDLDEYEASSPFMLAVAVKQ